MPPRAHDLWTTVQTEGALLPSDLLQRIAANDRTILGLRAEDYHLAAGERTNEAINRSWNRLLGAWSTFRAATVQLDSSDSATTVTRDRWLLPLFQELGYGRLPTARTETIDGRDYPVSHGWGQVPIHLVGAHVGLDHRTARVAGAARSSPHGLLQDLLNRSDAHLWGFVSNGLRLRILRDSTSLTRQAYVQWDLEAIMEGELYADFALLWLLCHQSRVEGERPEECWLERWSRLAQEQGARALDTLRDGVQAAIEALGRGFLRYTTNAVLRDRLRAGDLAAQDYYRQLLRLVYRLIFLFAAEDRDLLLDPKADATARARYLEFYSTRRLRNLAQRRRGTRHADLYHGLQVVMRALDAEAGAPALALPALGSLLWSPTAIPDLDGCEIANGELLEAVRALAYIVEGNVLRTVDYRNLGAEELGSVYEALLELNPQMHVETSAFSLTTASGSERKTTGSYYTPASLISALLDSALYPVLAEAARSSEPAEAILALTICDPACGSGAFLLAAAHRVARRLASVETGDAEPAPEALRGALRRVIGRCLYGIDLNPMAVELCKVSLWLEALEPGKPLSFLDHHIQSGNSLLGTTPALLRDGIPDAAFEPITGDDRAYASEWKRRNKDERKRAQMQLFDHALQPWERLSEIAANMAGLEEIDDSTPAGVRAKQERYETLVRSQEYLSGAFLADAWGAAFVWKKTSNFDYPITENVFREIERSPFRAATWMRDEIERLAEQYCFFHWHLRYPDVFRVPGTIEHAANEQAGWSGGFDVVLGNPPWNRVKLQAREWFATRRPEIANAPNAAARKEAIEALKIEDPGVYTAYLNAAREAEGESHLVRHSGRYPLTGRGDINTYAIFAETKRLIVGPTGQVGCILPSGIATDDTTKFFLQDILEKQALVSFFDFENRKGIFPTVQGNVRFCLLSLSATPQPHFRVAAQLDDPTLLADSTRVYMLSPRDIRAINPNTENLPTVRTARDVELLKSIHRLMPVFIREGVTVENPWDISFLAMIHMTNDSGMFRTREQLGTEGWVLGGNSFRRGADAFLPLYEAKLAHQYNHRAATFDGIDIAERFKLHAGTKTPSITELADPGFTVIPRFWIPEAEVRTRVDGGIGWLLGFRNAISAIADSRSLVATIIPLAGAGNSLPLVLCRNDAITAATLLAVMNSFVLDYVLRQKASGGNLNYYIFKQLPCPGPRTLGATAAWYPVQMLAEWILPRVLELTYTAWDLQLFAKECSYDGPPFGWDEERRFLVRCELDAAFFHVYGIGRDDVGYIMETFPIVKRQDVDKHGGYRTKQTILETYDAMARAMATGQLYQTMLDPPPVEIGLPERPSMPVPEAKQKERVAPAASAGSSSASTVPPAGHSHVATATPPATRPTTAVARPPEPRPAAKLPARSPTGTSAARSARKPTQAALPLRPRQVENAGQTQAVQPFRVGDRVRHEQWGEGNVVAVQGNGQDATITVQFRRGERKRLLLSMARLVRA